MKRILRYLMGIKGETPPSVQQRAVAAHELALKAVLRRRSREKEKGEVEVFAAFDVPPATEQVLPTPRPEGGEMTPLRSRKQRHAARKQRRRQQVALADQVPLTPDQQGTPAVSEVPPLRTRKQRHAARKQRRRQQVVLAEQAPSARDGQETIPIGEVPPLR